MKLLDSKQRRATLIGVTAILMWATLAILTELSGRTPPFQLTAMSFTVAFLAGVFIWVKDKQNPLQYLRLPKAVWALGVTGLFGYHFLYFLALKNAPVVEASLIAYLWPLLIVFFSALLPGETLRWFHAAGAVIGFIGVGLLVTRGQSISFDARYTTGYLAAFACALTWSSYSLLSRRFGMIPTSAVGGFCGATALLSWIFHFLFESTIWPSATEWTAILCLGIGPVGLAFFTWDFGVKHGNIKALGVLSYTAPLLSTILLRICGLAEATQTTWLACLLVIGGAVLASADFFQQTAHKK